jgi:hypothetical protein
MPNLVYLHVLINYAVPYLWDIIVAYRAQIHTANNHTPKINKKCAKNVQRASHVFRNEYKYYCVISPGDICAGADPR